MAPPRALVIAGPSGVGKGTLINKLKEEYPTTLGFSVSHTTRKPRAGEIDGVHYHFATHEAMKADIDAGKFVESAEVHGNYYGTSKAAIENVAKEGKLCILDIDVQGCRSVRKAKIPAVLVFVSPPSDEELEKRLRGRGTESQEQIEKRLKTAMQEIEAKGEPGLFDIEIVNDDLDVAYKKLKEIFENELKAADMI